MILKNTHRYIVLFALTVAFLFAGTGLVVASEIVVTQLDDIEPATTGEVEFGDPEYERVCDELLQKQIDKNNEQPKSRATGTVVDLGVTKIEVLKSLTGSTTHYPGQVVRFNTTLWNYGETITQGYDVVVAINDGYANSTILSKHFTTQFSEDTFFSYTWSYTPPLTPPIDGMTGLPKYEYPHWFTVVATIIIANDEDLTDNQLKAKIHINEAGFNPVLMTNKEKYTGFRVGSTYNLPFSLLNAGNEIDTIEIKVVDKPTNWTVLGYGELELDPEEIMYLNQTFTISTRRQDAMKGVNYKITLQASSINYPLASDLLTFTVTVDFSGGVKLHAPYKDDGHNVWVPPGEILYCTWEVENTGNYRDSFYTWAEPLSPSKTKQGWQIYVFSGQMTSVIQRGEKAEVVLRVAVPGGLMKGISVNVKLWSRSNTDSDVTSSAQVTIIADRKYDLNLDDPVGMYNILPGEESVVWFNLTNTGNGKDRTTEVKILEKPDGWVLGLITNEIPPDGLTYKTTAAIGLKLILGNDVAARDGYRIKIGAYTGIPQKKADELELTFNVLEKYGLKMSCQEPRKSGYVGGIVEYYVTLKNTGNVMDTFVLESTCEHKDWITFQDESVILASNMSRSVTVYINIPLDAQADTNPDTTLSFEGYSLDVRAWSLNDTNNVSIVWLTSNVQKVYNFIFENKDTGIQKLSSDYETKVFYDINVKNLGNIRDSVGFEVDYQTSPLWGEVLTDTFSIGYQEERVLKFRAEAPLGTKPGKYTFTIKGESKGSGGQVKDETTIEVEVESYEFIIDEILINGKPMHTLTMEEDNIYWDPDLRRIEIVPDQKILIQAVVTNTADSNYTGGFGPLVVGFGDAASSRNLKTYNITSLKSGETKTVGVSISFSAKQTLKLRVRLDPTGEIPEQNDLNNEERFNCNIKGIGDGGGGGDETPWFVQLIQIGIPVMLAMILIFFIVLTLRAYSNIRLSVLDTGYTKEGEYKPYAEMDDTFDEDEEEEEDEEDDFEVEFDPDHPYSTSAPYSVLKSGPAAGSGGGGGGGGSPYALPPASPYSMAAASAPSYSLGDGSDGGGNVAGYLPPASDKEYKPEDEEYVDQDDLMKTSAPATTKPATTTTAPVSTKPAASKPVTTSAPVSSKPVTSAPVTSKPPTTSKPVTSAPVSSKPVTSAPVTSKPPTTTSAPVSSKPVTSAPVTSKPPTTTSAPVSSKPTSLKDVLDEGGEEKKDDKPVTSLKDLLGDD